MIELILTLAIAGFVVWIVLQIPMPDIFRKIIIGVVAFALVIWVLQSFGLVSGFRTLRLPR